MKAGMIRKQVYIERHHEQMLKRRSSQRGITEAELIREALDNAEAGARTGRQTADPVAAQKALAFMRSLRSSRHKASTSRSWTRESLYEDRIGRWTKS
ncbi:MAG: hypothetical protein QOK37_4215 [Thermoanaerobaculia bacterium]|jgi:hypothetical protein|nr:hypothetical protein [Thermoanaerobaculia bacterium]